MTTSHWATRPESANEPDVEFDLLVQEPPPPSGSTVWLPDDSTEQWATAATDPYPASVTWRVAGTGERLSVPHTGSHAAAADTVATTGATTASTAAEYAAEPGIPGRGAILATLAATAAVAALNLALVGGLTFFFDVCFVVVGLVAAMAVRRHDLFTAAVLPPLAFAAVIGAVAALFPDAILPDASLSKVFMVGLTTHADGLVGGYGAALLVVGARLIARRQLSAP